ncbi:MAG: membrane protein insertase YidC [Bryobacterales bacterium]|nr:membrane protein insertase YidC [Bryobacterales bacterium]
MPDTKQGKKFELTMEMRMLLAFLLMGAVFLLTPLLTGPQQKPAPKAPEAKQVPAAKPAPAPAVAPQAASPAAPPVIASVKAAEKAEQYVVETGVHRVVFSNQGAVVKSWQLKSYKDNNGKLVELVNAHAAPKAGWPMSYVFRENPPKTDLNQALFVRKDTGDPLTVEFEFSDGTVTAHKTFRFTKSAYRLQVTSEVIDAGQARPHLLGWRGGFGDHSIHNAAATQHSVYYNAANSKLVIEDAKAAKDGPIVASGQFSFGGLEDSYFAAVFLPPAGSGLDVQTWSDSIAPAGEKDEVPHVGAAVGSVGNRNDLTLFVGPKNLDVLRTANPKLELLVDYGWLGILAKPLFLALNWVHNNLIPNWGWAIVFVTVIINFLLLPLRFSSIRSMQAMAALQPEIQKINEKYKGVGLRDPKVNEKNQEMMALYQKHGINPMGGCVPLLLQMPFFFAFFKVLSVSIELRGAPWLWVSDLSQPEFSWVRILPILMIVTQVIMQKMTPQTSPDPNQQRMMMLMPLMMGVLFYSSPSGLVLYWLTGNVVGIFQQYFFNRYVKTHVPATVPVSNPKKSKG